MLFILSNIVSTHCNMRRIWMFDIAVLMLTIGLGLALTMIAAMRFGMLIGVL